MGKFIFRGPRPLVFALYLAAFLPILIHLLLKVGVGSLGPLAGFINTLALFPTPLVFQDDSYLHQRELHVAFPGGGQTFKQSDLIRESYSLIHRFDGVLLWHFLKYSSEWPDANIRTGLQMFFCENGADLGLFPQPLNQNISSISMDYKIHFYNSTHNGNHDVAHDNRADRQVQISCL